MIGEESKVADVLSFVEQELASHEFLEDLKQFISDQAINGRAFVSLTDEKLKDWGLSAAGKRGELLALVNKYKSPEEEKLDPLTSRIVADIYSPEPEYRSNARVKALIGGMNSSLWWNKDYMDQNAFWQIFCDEWNKNIPKSWVKAQVLHRDEGGASLGVDKEIRGAPQNGVHSYGMRMKNCNDKETWFKALRCATIALDKHFPEKEGLWKFRVQLIVELAAGQTYD